MSLKTPLIATTAVVLGTALSGCVTVIGDHTNETVWHGNNAQPFDASRDACRETTRSQRAFVTCMGDRGWHQSRD